MTQVYMYLVTSLYCIFDV